MLTRRRSRGGERGAVLVLVAPLILSLFAISALVIDLGNARQESRHVQGSADAASLAGARDLPVRPPVDSTSAEAVKAEAARYVNLNVTGADVIPAPVTCTGTVPANASCYELGNTKVVVATPYTGAPPGSPKAYSLVYVKICQPTATFFAGVLGVGSPTVCRDAVGHFENEARGFGMGLVVIHPTACKALEFAGASSTVLSSNGAVMVNSNCTTNALDASGSAWRLTASYIGVVGTAALAPCDPTSSSTCTSTIPEEGIYPFDNPLGHIQPPDPIPPNSGTHSCSPTDGTRVMYPGRYPNTCSFNDNNDYIFRPGVYYFANGFSTNGNADLVCDNTATTMATLTGLCDGVTFIIAGGSITLNGDSKISLPAPTTGPYAGISIYQLSSSASTINGSNQFLLGTVYAPNAPFTFSGSGGAGGDQVNIEGMVVTNTATISGSFGFNINVPEQAPEAYPKDQLNLWE